MARDEQQAQAMTSERLAHWHWVMAKHSEPQSMSSVVIDVRDLAAFVAEVERQRAALAAKEAREAALVAEREQAMAIVRAVAAEATLALYPAVNSGNDQHEMWCTACLCIQVDDESVHDDTCLVTQARALLAAGEQGEA